MKLSRDKRAATASRGGRAEGTAAADHGLREGLDGLRDLMDRLLGPDGCPWDREQTLDSLRPYLLEEVHEVLEAMDDPSQHRRELGDLLFQIVFQSALREREGAFNLDDVIDGIVAKMIRRHPHVFAPPGTDGPTQARSARDVSEQWERIKREERSTTDGPPDPLGNIPKTLPSLQRAWRLQEKAAAIGFDWPDVEGALAKLREEWDELEEARAEGDPRAIREELGDFLFVLVRVGHKLGVEPEAAMQEANAKFERRFTHMMRRCHELGIDPAEAGLEKLELWWNEAKQKSS